MNAASSPAKRPSPFPSPRLFIILAVTTLAGLASFLGGCSYMEKGFDSVAGAFRSNKDAGAQTPEERKAVSALLTQAARESLGMAGSGTGAAEKAPAQADKSGGRDASAATGETEGAKESLARESETPAPGEQRLPIKPDNPQSLRSGTSGGGGYLGRFYNYVAGFFGDKPHQSEESAEATAKEVEAAGESMNLAAKPGTPEPAAGGKAAATQAESAQPESTQAEPTQAGAAQEVTAQPGSTQAAAPTATAQAQETAKTVDRENPPYLDPTPEEPANQGALTANQSGKDKKVRFELNIQKVDVGMPLNQFGENLAVIPARDGHRCIGLNGVSQSEAYFPGKKTKNFEIEAKVDYNFPIHEGGELTAELLSMRLGASARRKLMVSLKQGEAEPPMAMFSMGGPKLAPDMFCSEQPVRWKEDSPDAVTNLVIKKEAGALRIEYDGEMVCSSPLDPTLVLREIAFPMDAQTLIYDLALTKLPDSDIPGMPETKQDKLAAAKASLVSSGAMTGQPFPEAETAHEEGVTRIDLSRMSPGTPIGKFGQNLIVLGDVEGKYVASTSPKGSNVLVPAKAGENFSLDILIRNAFKLSERVGRTDRFFLFTINYKSGIKEVYTLNLTRDENLVWRSRYFISRSGPNIMAWTAATDYKPWNNSLDFNEYKVIKDKGLLRFFFNGEFIRNETSKGDAFESVKVNLRQNERLYDVIIRDLDVAGKNAKEPTLKERKLKDDQGKGAGAQSGDEAATPPKENNDG